MSWRFADPKEELKPAFKDAVARAETQADWTFTAKGNWMILPTRLLEGAGNESQHFNEAMIAINSGDQSFCAATAEDLERILLMLESAAASEC
ncbi:hypothetical protein [Streptomyces sp. NPDC127084]|uniref:hypothetical protein n=1 Tax=Streptomyces sp. NPDC127084 TaxID=3347133 RepID=UPI0036642F55